MATEQEADQAASESRVARALFTDLVLTWTQYCLGEIEKQTQALGIDFTLDKAPLGELADQLTVILYG